MLSTSLVILNQSQDCGERKKKNTKKKEDIGENTMTKKKKRPKKGETEGDNLKPSGKTC